MMRPTEKVVICSYIFYYLITNQICASSHNKIHKTVITNINSINMTSQDLLDTTVTELMDKYAQQINKAGVNQPFMIHFKIDRWDNKTTKYLNNLSNTLNRFDRNGTRRIPKLLVSIRVTNNQSIVKLFENSELVMFINKNSQILSGVSVKIENAHSDCEPVDSKSKWITVLKSFKIFLQNQGKNTIRIGYEIDYKDIKSNCYKEIIRLADYLVINVPLCRNDNIFVESFGIFRRNMNHITDKISNITREIKGYQTKVNNIYYHISLKPDCDLDRSKLNIYRSNKQSYQHCKNLTKAISEDQVISLETYKRYNNLLTKYTLEWRMIQSDITLIQNYESVFQNSSADNESKSAAYISDSQITGSELSAGLLIQEIAKSGFQIFIIEKRLAQMLEKCKGAHHFQYLCRTLDNYNITYFTADLQNSKVLYEMPTSYYVNSTEPMKPFQLSYFSTSDKCDSFTPQNCAFDMHESSYNKCGYCFDSLVLHANGFHASLNEIVLVWKGNLTFTKMDLKVDNDTFVNQIMKQLSSFLIARKIINAEHPNRQIRIHFKGQIYNEIENQVLLYCSDLIKNISQLYDAVLTWARIHEIPITFEPFLNNSLLDIGNPFAWEDLLSHNNITDLKHHPVFIRRRHNQSKIFGNWAQGAYPCIHKSEKRDSIEALRFDDNYLGVTLDFNIRPGTDTLRVAEFQTLLFLAMSKFQSVLMILDASHFYIFRDILKSPNFVLNLRHNDIKTTRLYLQVENIVSDLNYILLDIIKMLEKAGFIVHTMYTLTYNDRVRRELTDFDKNGIVHPHCRKLSRQIANTPEEPDEKLKNVKYLICEIKPVTAKTSDEIKMQIMLNLHLYFNKTIRYYYPNIREIHFRLQLKFVHHNSEENLLFFLADLAKYAKAYEIHYFPLPAFVDEKFQNATASFWSVSNYSNLADASVFKEYQAEYLNLNTTVPIIISQNKTQKYESTSQQSQHVPTTTLVIIGSTITALVISGVLVKVLYKLHKKRRNISDKEIEEFYDGHKETLELAARECKVNKHFNGNIFDGLMYQKDYELSQSVEDINLHHILNEGKYSTVHRTKIEGIDVDVAIKITDKKCPKQIFKGFLSEVKQLCYIGEHPNLVSFVGCYSQEVKKHVLWIVTEFCGRGKLLDYLNGLKLLNREEWTVQQLFRFSGEIACGMDYISNQNALHGGLCTKHVLLTQNLTCKISNLSFTRKLAEYQAHLNNNNYEKLPWQWMAPESLRKLEFSKMSDVWSCGVTLWEIFSLGEIPYSNVKLSTHFINSLEKGMRMESPTFATKETYKVMLQCWDAVPNNRPRFTTLNEHFTGKHTHHRLSSVQATTELECTASNIALE